ncbi:hypothetical protein CONPUDRAFT_30644, partial [Coniophora puteana RWD-64-598 SS2]
GDTVSWSTKWQEVVLLSTTESEYIATMHTAKKTLRLCSLIREVIGPLDEPTKLFLDNQSAITLAHNHQYHSLIQNIDI